MRKFNTLDLRFPLCLFGVLSFLTCCNMITSEARPEGSRYYVTGDSVSSFTLTGDRWEMLAASAGNGLPKINPNWTGGMRLSGLVDSTYLDPFTGARMLALRVTYVGQIMDNGLERSREMAFLDGGLWAGGHAKTAISDSTAGPINGWFFRREYADIKPPVVP